MVDQVWRIGRVSPTSGFYEAIWFTGSKHQIPKGWVIIESPHR
jgi:hypothetical protein